MADEIADLLPRLRMFFANRGARQHANDLASEVVTRVLSARSAGKDIENVTAFAFGTAKLVWLEQLRAKQSAPVELDVDPEAPPARLEAPQEDVRCLKRCLLHLPPESRRLFMDYVAGPGKNKERRSRLASGLGISANALQSRIGAIKATLRKCLETCAAILGGRDTVGADQR